MTEASPPAKEPSELLPIVSDALQRVRRILTDARELGLLGPSPLDDQIEHSLAFADVINSESGTSADSFSPPPPTLSILDLGSGGGVPGLLLAIALPCAQVTLLDGSTRRAGWLSLAVADLDLVSRVNVVCERAETFGRRVGARGAYDAITSRSFGPPAVVAECSAPLLRVGGYLVVSEPPTEEVTGARANSLKDRWPDVGIAQFGFGPAVGRSARGRHFAELELVVAAPEYYPRRVGIPQKRPRF
ncbi:MAG: 16S rRNA (guanine(527)-N(7))-methyltransferase RsmG [Acidimicrobiales bacterium]